MSTEDPTDQYVGIFMEYGKVELWVDVGDDEEDIMKVPMTKLRLARLAEGAATALRVFAEQEASSKSTTETSPEGGDFYRYRIKDETGVQSPFTDEERRP